MQNITRIVKDQDTALALIIRLSLTFGDFRVKINTQGEYEISVPESGEQLLNEDFGPSYVVLQEGGSSTELYVHAHASEEEAEEDRESCAADSYRTSNVIKVPPVVAALEERFYSVIDSIVASSLDLEYADVAENA